MIGKRLIALLFVVLFCSCDFRVVRNPDVLTRFISSDPVTLNPVLAGDANSFLVYKYVYESLLDRDYDTLEMKPNLATRWEVSPDHLTYTFWLREDVKWQDGKPFTADDVVFTFEKIRDPKVDAAALRNYFNDVTKVESLGSYVVKFTYAKPYFKALEILTGATIIPKHIFNDGQDFNSHPANRAPIGTGPYRFGKWKTGRFISLVKNEDYWGEEPEVTGMEFDIVSDQMVAFEMLKKGALDLSPLNPIQWTRQAGIKQFGEKNNKVRYFLPNYFFIAWNERTHFFSDRRVRIAMTELIDRRSIIDKILFGQGEMITNSFYRFGRVYDNSIEPYPFDPIHAAKLLNESGWIDHDGDGVRDKNGVPFRFKLLLASGNKSGKNVGLFLTEELSKVGIKMEMVEVESATMLGLVKKREFDALSLGMATPIEEDPYQVWHSSESARGSNISSFSNKRADEIIELARTEFGPQKRRELYQEFQKIIHEEEPYTFLYTVASLLAVSKRFDDVVAHKFGVDVLEWKIGEYPALYQW